MYVLEKKKNGIEIRHNKYKMSYWGLLILLGLIFILLHLVFRKAPVEIRRATPEGSILYQERPLTDDEMQVLRNTPLLIGSLAYNSNIQVFRKRIEHLTGESHQWHLFLYGLDSTNPQTLEDLQRWSLEDPKHVTVIPLLIQPKPKNRMARMAMLRNALIDTARATFKKGSFNSLDIPSSLSSVNSCDPDTLMLMYDSDHAGAMSKIGLVNAIQKLQVTPAVYAIAASGTHSLLPHVDILYDTFAECDMNGNPSLLCKVALHSCLPPWTPMQSAFGGACLYRWSQLQTVSYPFFEGVCEHASLHKLLYYKYGGCLLLSKNFHIYVNEQPSQY
ncbi:MAG: hypothetical protein Sylvanvirus16_17 [Sylvanvirus sp.]|uniref:Uncharacterized protein n=1 Tax=Sylvanvirus sp. TaxID=2487774 RepID=A0A3G5AIH5_9VIRU|nr:MAG: hypothetical protein Sylvanvirus16_17 [Sylvanvirus sp.]